MRSLGFDKTRLIFLTGLFILGAFLSFSVLARSTFGVSILLIGRAKPVAFKPGKYWIAYRDAFYSGQIDKFCNKNICRYDAYLYFDWNELEPTEGNYRFNKVDQLLRHISSQKVSLPNGAHRPRQAFIGVRIYSSYGAIKEPIDPRTVKVPQYLRSVVKRVKCGPKTLYVPDWSDRLTKRAQSLITNLIKHIDNNSAVAGYVVTLGWDEELTPAKAGWYSCVNSASLGDFKYYNGFVIPLLKSYEATKKPVLLPIAATKPKYSKILAGYVEKHPNWAFTSHAIRQNGSDFAYVWAKGNTNNVDYGGGWMQVIRSTLPTHRPGFEYGGGVGSGPLPESEVYWTMIYALAFSPQVMDFQAQFLETLDNVNISPVVGWSLSQFAYEVMNDPDHQKVAYIIFRGLDPSLNAFIKGHYWNTDHPWHYEAGIHRKDLSFENYADWARDWKKEVFCSGRGCSKSVPKLQSLNDYRFIRTVSPNGNMLGDVKLKLNKNFSGSVSIYYVGGPFVVKVAGKSIHTCEASRKVGVCVFRAQQRGREVVLQEIGNTYFHSLAIVYD